MQFSNDRFPGLLQPNPDQIPAELKAIPQWIVWFTEYDPQSEKWTKIPRQPAFTNIGASKNKKTHFSDFDTAYAAYQKYPYLGGVGFVLTPDTPFVFFDLDHCVNDGFVSPDAQDVIDSVGSYTELSPSGKGIRIICRGELPGKQINNHRLKRELYDGQKNSFLTITGQTFINNKIVSAQQQVNFFYKEWDTHSTDEKSIISFKKDFIADVDLSNLPPHTLRLIHGENWSSFPSRSEALFVVCIDMLKAGYSTDDILSVTTDDNYPISQIAESRRHNNRESQRIWVSNYSLSKAMTIYNEWLKTESISISELIETPSIESNQITEKAPDRFPVPILNEIMEWMELYEDKPTRSITMQGVIALVSVVCGRIYQSNRANDSSLFLMTLAETGRGKGYPAKAIRKLLIKAGFGHLIKGGGNTSASAVFSALRESPCHIQITDEIGKQYQAARKQSNGQMLEGLAQLTSIYSLTGDIAYPRNRSTEGLTKTQAASLGNRFIMYPSLTLFGFATLEQVFDNLSTSDIDDGFLNRQIIVISDDERLPERDRIMADVPAHFLQWVKDIRSTIGIEGNFTKNDSVYDMEPSYLTVTIADGVYKLFKAFRNENESLEDQDARKLAIRWNENAMRMATGFAVAVNPINPVVTLDIARWCMYYIKYHGLRFIRMANNSISDNEFHRLRQQVLKCIENQKTKGISYSKIKDFSRIWASSSKQLRDQVMTTLIDDDLILKAVPTAKTGKGRPATLPTYFSTKYVSVNTEEV